MNLAARAALDTLRSTVAADVSDSVWAEVEKQADEVGVLGLTGSARQLVHGLVLKHGNHNQQSHGGGKGGGSASDAGGSAGGKGGGSGADVGSTVGRARVKQGADDMNLGTTFVNNGGSYHTLMNRKTKQQTYGVRVGRPVGTKQADQLAINEYDAIVSSSMEANGMSSGRIPLPRVSS